MGEGRLEGKVTSPGDGALGVQTGRGRLAQWARPQVPGSQTVLRGSDPGGGPSS